MHVQYKNEKKNVRIIFEVNSSFLLPLRHFHPQGQLKVERGLEKLLVGSKKKFFFIETHYFKLQKLNT